ncbi:MAG: hypothetical protein QOI10_2732 [Solirubrobacterales bacterium]|nr:hypothetical protein [Solirubrobacterales bacterium]
MQEESPESSPFAGERSTSWALRRFWRANVRPVWRQLRAPIIVLLGLTVIVFGTIGYGKLGDDWWEALFKSFQLYAFGGSLQSGDPLVLNIARVLGPLLVGVAAIRGLLVLSREQLRLIGFRLFRRNHTVIVGLGDVGFKLAASLNDLGERVIAIDRDATQPSIAGCRERGISVLVGDAADPDLLRTACVHRASYLIVAPGSDGVAADVVAAAAAITTDRADRPLKVIAHIEDRALWQALRAHTVSHGDGPDLEVEFFNLYETAGRLVLDRDPPFSAEAAAGHRGPRVLIVADQAIAEVLIVNAARLWRNSRADERARIVITLAAAGAEAECERLRERYPAIDSIADLDPWEIDLASPAVRESARNHDAGAAYVALGDEARGAAVALTLAATNPAGRKIVLAINDRRLGAALIAGADGGTGAIRLFGILELVLSPRFLVDGLRETLARAMHDSYERSQLATGETELPYVKPWAALEDDAKSSNRDFAADIPRKLTAVGCMVVPAALPDVERSTRIFEQHVGDRLEELAEAEHERWMAERIRSGWSYAAERDNAAKLHDCLVPYEQLSEADKEKDRVTIRELPEMLAKAGFAIERTAS